MTEQIGYLNSCPTPFLTLAVPSIPDSLEKEALLTSPSLLVVGVRVHEELQQGVVQLGVGVALLGSHGLLHEPDEVLLDSLEL